MAPYSDKSEVMTLAEVAEYLQLAEKTVLRMVRRQEIPAAKIASQWRFLRSVVRDWLAGQMQSMPPARVAQFAAGQAELLPLREIVRPELMNLAIVPGPKEDILRQLLDPIRQTGFARDAARLLADLLERERMMTTAVGHGVAIPHPRRPIPGMFAEPAVALGVCPAGADYEAIDDQRVHLFFLICATREEVHLKLMAKISWLMRRPQTADRLRGAASPAEAMDVVRTEAKGLERAGGNAGASEIRE